MARKTREKSADGFYAVKISRQNGENIFFDSEDYEKIWEILKNAKEKYGCSVLAYSFIENEIDMVLKTPDISAFMKQLVFQCSKYLKNKYKIGENIFKKRYFSRALTKGEIPESVVKIHNIPVKFHKCDENGSYEFSSFSSYFGKNEFVDTDIIFETIKPDDFLTLHYTFKEESEENGEERIFNIKKSICGYLGLSDFREIKYIDKNAKKEVICALYYEKSFRAVDIAKVFGVGRQRVYTILKNSCGKTIDKI